MFPYEYRRALAEAAAEKEQAQAKVEELQAREQLRLQVLAVQKGRRISEAQYYNKEDDVILEDVLKSAKEVVSFNETQFPHFFLFFFFFNLSD